MRRRTLLKFDPTLTLPCKGRGLILSSFLGGEIERGLNDLFHFSSPVPLSRSKTFGTTSDGFCRAESAALFRETSMAVIARS